MAAEVTVQWESAGSEYRASCSACGWWVRGQEEQALKVMGRDHLAARHPALTAADKIVMDEYSTLAGPDEPKKISGTEVLTRVAIYVVGMYGSRWQARRQARKHGAPDWAIDMAGRLTVVAGSRGWIEMAELNNEGAREVGKYLGDGLVELLEQWSKRKEGWWS